MYGEMSTGGAAPARRNFSRPRPVNVMFFDESFQPLRILILANLQSAVPSPPHIPFSSQGDIAKQDPSRVSRQPKPGPRVNDRSSPKSWDSQNSNCLMNDSTPLSNGDLNLDKKNISGTRRGALEGKQARLQRRLMSISICFGMFQVRRSGRPTASEVHCIRFRTRKPPKLPKKCSQLAVFPNRESNEVTRAESPFSSVHTTVTLACAETDQKSGMVSEPTVIQ